MQFCSHSGVFGFESRLVTQNFSTYVSGKKFKSGPCAEESKQWQCNCHNIASTLMGHYINVMCPCVFVTKALSSPPHSVTLKLTLVLLNKLRCNAHF